MTVYLVLQPSQQITDAIHLACAGIGVICFSRFEKKRGPMRKSLVLAVLVMVLFSGMRAGTQPPLPNYTTFLDITIYLPVIMTGYPSLGVAPILNPINNPGGSGSYTVSWSTVLNATRYILEEDDSDTFASPLTVYEGASISSPVTKTLSGTYFYRAKGANPGSSTAWSNIQSTTVVIAPTDCPKAGSWSGSGYRFTINFRVVHDGSQCSADSFTGHLTATCHIPQGATWNIYVQYIAQPTTIQDSHFQTSGSSIQLEGDFTAYSSAQGSVNYYSWDPGSNATCRLSTTWNATSP